MLTTGLPWWQHRQTVRRNSLTKRTKVTSATSFNRILEPVDAGRGAGMVLRSNCILTNISCSPQWSCCFSGFFIAHITDLSSDTHRVVNQKPGQILSGILTDTILICLIFHSLGFLSSATPDGVSVCMWLPKRVWGMETRKRVVRGLIVRGPNSVPTN